MQPETTYERLQRKILKPLTYRAFTYVTVGMTVLLVLPAIFILSLAFSADTPVNLTILLSILAATLLALPARVAFVTLRRKWMTGQILPTDEERVSNRYKWAMQQESPRYRKIMTAIWTGLAIFWILFTAYMVHAAFHTPSKRGFATVMIFLAALNFHTPFKMLRDLRQRATSI